MKRIISFLILFLPFSHTFAQKTNSFLQLKFQNWEQKINDLSYSDPEIVSLHYLILQDIIKDINTVSRTFASSVASDTTLDFYATQKKFKHFKQKVENLHIIFKREKDVVDYKFYNIAKEDLAFRDTARAIYHLDRALQYNPHNPEALLEMAKISLAKRNYAESVELVHKLYEQTELNEKQEMAVSDFTLELYEKLYSHGSALIKSGRAAEALEVFTNLEHFCNNMPSGYCNDDYYKGLMLSREGVYESYITIAKEAEKRGNHEMARKFYNYAAEYFKNKDN